MPIVLDTDQTDSLSELFADLWLAASRADVYDEGLWLELVANIPLLEVRAPSGACVETASVQEALERSTEQRRVQVERLVIAVRSDATSAADFDEASWERLEARLGPDRTVEPGVRLSLPERRLANLREEIRRNIDSIEANGPSALGMETMRRHIARADHLGAGAAWLRWQLAQLLERTGELDEAIAFIEEATNADPSCLDFAALRDRLRAERSARRLGWTGRDTPSA